jgi:hypothetical protein
LDFALAKAVPFWRAYGVAFLSNQWYPDQLNNVGFDLSAIWAEFRPDVKRKVLRRK